MNIGKDIIGTMTNTLILAFAGIFMQIILIFIIKLFSIHDYELFLVVIEMFIQR